ncbi:Imm42 family immunity protein [Schlesneria paludicola]|uniref:Imm42 family immunity protein n=1 Tax=Schlesneria paludicola TaxID=360056 RepID=UPI00029A2E29|nr:Imm42 family immunity protein [Schlesneria paludicola]
MIVGDPSVFAIESHIACAYERLSALALGFFVIIIDGRVYGVRQNKATMLACSFQEVISRLKNRGQHRVSVATDARAADIADDFRNAVYNDDELNANTGVPLPEYSRILHNARAVWAPDGDEAFDDGSYVLQFDVDERVRLIAFKTKGRLHDPSTLSDIWISADYYYSVLKTWSLGFQEEWSALPKKAEV